MLAWISRVLGLVGSAVEDTIKALIHDLISGLYGFLHTIFGNVIKAWQYFWNATRNLRGGLENFASECWITFYHLYKYVLPGIERWAIFYFTSIKKYAEDVYHWAIRVVDALERDIVNTANTIRRWVVTDIWNPIWHILTQAWDWITHEGTVLWHYITHAADLVDLIWDALIAKIEAEAWTIGAKLGTFFFSLVIHNLKRFALLLEDIIDAVL